MSFSFARAAAFAALALTGSGAFAATSSIYSVQRSTGSYYKVEYPLLLAPEKAVDAVNASIRKELLVDEEPCETAKGSKWEQSLDRVTYVEGALFGFSVSASGYCAGAAHDASYTLSYSYDLTTGALVDLESQLKAGGTETVRAAMIQHAKADPEICGGGLVGQEDLVYPDRFALQPWGIDVGTAFGHAYRACDFSVQIPYSQLKDDLAPGSLAARLAKAANANK